MGLAAGVVALLLVSSAVLTAVHDAAFRIGSSHLRTLEEEGFAGADVLRRVRDHRHEIRTSVRVFTQVLDLVALAVIALTGVSTWGAASPLVSTIVGVAIVVVLAELIPHLIASRRPVRLALSAARLLLWVRRAARPFVGPVTRLEDRLGNDVNVVNDEHRELREIQEIGEEEGVLEASENLLVERAFRLDELTAWDVMIPRVDVFAWSEDRTVRDVVDELANVPYSRVPVYKESVDEVTGIVYVREAYTQVAKGHLDVTLGELARDPFFVPGSLSLSQLLKGFQARRIHMGIVADEFGGTDGLVTLEDVLEELVGEIVDETDIEQEEIIRVGDDVVVCDAAVDLRDLDDVLGVSMRQGEHRSLNGFILDELGHVPKKGERFETEGVLIEVVEASETQVRRARLVRLGERQGAELEES